MPIKLKKVNFKEAADEIKSKVERGALASGQSKNKTKDGVIIILALIIFTLVLGGFGYYKFQIGRASLAWPAVEGEITVSHVVKERRNSKDHYTPVVNYKYTVEGENHIGGRLSADDQGKRYSSKATEALEDFPVGAMVPVYYNPDDPKKAVLVPGVQRVTYYLLIAAAACLFFAFVVTVSLIKKLIRDRTS